jgi:hypothetical protein
MSPDKRRAVRRRHGASASKRPPTPRSAPSSDDQYEVVYFKHHVEDDPSEKVPAREFLDRCPVKVRSLMRAVLVEVARSKKGQFAGGGYWEPMHDDMAGYYEVRVDGPKRRHYRLFCLIDSEAQGCGSLLVVITGMSKPFLTTFTKWQYEAVRRLGTEYKSRNPRSIA